MRRDNKQFRAIRHFRNELLVQICAQVIEELRGSFQEEERRPWRGAIQDPADGLVELNERFLRAGVGYQYENGEIIRVDRRYVHGAEQGRICILPIQQVV